MLSEQEKKEMLADAMDKTRKNGFRAAKAKTSRSKVSFDNYLYFLDGIQEVYGPFTYNVKYKPLKNKL